MRTHTHTPLDVSVFVFEQYVRVIARQHDPTARGLAVNTLTGVDVRFQVLLDGEGDDI